MSPYRRTRSPCSLHRLQGVKIIPSHLSGCSYPIIPHLIEGALKLSKDPLEIPIRNRSLRTLRIFFLEVRWILTSCVHFLKDTLPVFVRDQAPRRQLRPHIKKVETRQSIVHVISFAQQCASNPICTIKP